MLGVVLFAVAFAQPAPTPLKTITHAHASPFCTAMRENIGRAVEALIKNNVAIAQGKSVLLQMAKDQISTVRYRSDPSSQWTLIDVDMVKVDRTIGDMVKNLGAADAALNDLKHIPDKPATDDDRRLIEMRDRLRAVADRQRDALNLFSGMYYSFSSNELLAKSNPLASALKDGKGAPDAPAPTAAPQAPAIVPAESSHTATPLPAARPSPVPVVDVGLAAKTPWASLFNALTTYQLSEAPLESQAAKTVVQYSDECK